MLKKLLPLAICTLLLAPGNTALSQSELQKSLNDLQIAPHWIYDDFSAAMSQAKTTGKPLLVVLRCVPCPPGKTLDSAVMQPEAEMEKLEKNFVCVRIVQTNGLDLKQFQYDFDMSWAAMILNADGTVYGRYGTRAASGPKSDEHISLASFRKTLERALELHKSYPANKGQLADKLGKAPEYSVPEQIPGLQDRPKVATTKQTCIHCHMVKENIVRTKWQENRLSAADLHVYPMPERIGLTMDIDDGLLVRRVADGSAAAKAGLATGDQLSALNGQPLTSMADIQWVLHTSPSEAAMKVELRRDGQKLSKTVTLSGDWKVSDLAWRASSWLGLRNGLKLDPVPAAEREKRGLGADQPALVVKGMFGKGAPKLQQAGLKNGDIVVAVDGKPTPQTESDFLIDLRLRHGPDDSVKLTVLRGDQRQELSIPLW